MNRRVIVLSVMLVVVLATLGLKSKILSPNVPEGSLNDSYLNLIQNMNNGDEFMVSPVLADYQVSTTISDNNLTRFKEKSTGKVYTWRDVNKKTKSLLKDVEYALISGGNDLKKFKNGRVPTDILPSSGISAFISLPLRTKASTTEDDTMVYIKEGVKRAENTYYIDLADGIHQLIIYGNVINSNPTDFEGVLAIPREIFYSSISLDKTWKSMNVDISELNLDSVNQVIWYELRGNSYQNEKIEPTKIIQKPYNFVVMDKNSNIAIAGGRKNE